MNKREGPPVKKFSIYAIEPLIAAFTEFCDGRPSRYGPAAMLILMTLTRKAALDADGLLKLQRAAENLNFETAVDWVWEVIKAQRPSRGILANPIFELQEVGDTPCDAFVLMPFSDDLRPVYEDHIKKVVENLGLSVGRADNFFTTHSVIDDIWTGIYKSKVVIADCTGRNANVFYEIAIAHTLGKDVVLLSQDIKDIPFDVQHLRCLLYQMTPRGMAKFENELSKTLEPWSEDTL